MFGCGVTLQVWHPNPVQDRKTKWNVDRTDHTRLGKTRIKLYTMFRVRDQKLYQTPLCGEDILSMKGGTFLLKKGLNNQKSKINILWTLSFQPHDTKTKKGQAKMAKREKVSCGRVLAWARVTSVSRSLELLLWKFALKFNFRRLKSHRDVVVLN